MPLLKSDGADHVKIVEAFPEVADNEVGAVAEPIGVATTTEGVPVEVTVPATYLGVTRNSYEVPFTRPAIR